MFEKPHPIRSAILPLMIVANLTAGIGWSLHEQQPTPHNSIDQSASPPLRLTPDRASRGEERPPIVTPSARPLARPVQTKPVAPKRVSYPCGVGTPHSQAVAYGHDEGIKRFGASEWEALFELWRRESGWDPKAHFCGGSACGIPQANPCSKMPGYPDDYKAQIQWGLGYIEHRYKTPKRALAHKNSYGWY